MSLQEQVSESTTKTVLEKLLPDTRYSVTVVPVYAEGDGPSLSDTGKTSEYLWLKISLINLKKHKEIVRQIVSLI